MRGEVFSWRNGNEFELLIDGAAFFPRMLSAIAAAQQQVDLELYLVEDGHCSEALVAALAGACARGVQVRLLFDAYGSAGLGARLRKQLRDSGVQLRFYNPVRWRRGLRNFHRDHRKLLLIDQRLGFVGGTGATDEFWQPNTGESLWHEVMVQMHGPVLADWQRLFDEQFNARFAWQLNKHWLPVRLPAWPPAQVGLGRVAYADAAQHRDILRALLKALARAKQRVWLATPYFLPTWAVRRALRRAAKRGVEVRLLLAGERTDHPPVRYAAQRYYRRLMKAGVRIYEYQPSFLHLKMVLVDDWVSVGSCNFDHWNLRFNLDANLEARDPAFTQAVELSFVHDFALSQEIDRHQWRRRPWWQRWRQRLWGLLDRLSLKIFGPS